MRVALVGVGKMGSGMRDRLRESGHEVIGVDHRAELNDVGSIEEAISCLGDAVPKVVWVMVPAGPATRAVVFELAGLLGPATS